MRQYPSELSSFHFQEDETLLVNFRSAADPEYFIGRLSASIHPGRLQTAAAFSLFSSKRDSKGGNFNFVLEKFVMEA